MKNFIIFSAMSIMLASTASAAIEVQVDKTTIPGQTMQNGQTRLPADKLNQKDLNLPADKMNTPKPVDINSNQGEKANDANFVPDHDLSKAIYKAIRDDRIFSTDSKVKVIVTVFNGKVTLSGDVTSQAEKERAELLANQINHLKGVTNNIRIIK